MKVDTEVEPTEEELDGDIDFEKLEQIIDNLLAALKESDTVIWYVAAQGIGKITGRLTLDFADQIVEQILELFNDSDLDNAW